jgi:hypothetical protein
MLILAGILAVVATLLWIADSCLPDTSIDFVPSIRILLALSGLLIGLNTLIASTD